MVVLTMIKELVSLLDPRPSEPLNVYYRQVSTENLLREDRHPSQNPTRTKAS